ncbi:ABC transporter ATP-binding protein [Clostridium sporogenes]
MKIFRNITVGNEKRLIKPIVYSILSNFINVLPFVLSIEAVSIIFKAFSTEQYQLDTKRLWIICGVLVVYMVVMFIGEIPAYCACYRGAYKLSADGRAELAEHLRKLPLGYISSRDPGDLANMMMGDFALIETGISHLVPQLIGALVMPVFAFIGLCFIDWRMALAMFISLPLAIIVLTATTKFQQRLSDSHMSAKINAANRLQEYLNGLRIIKAYNMTGEKFTRLDKSFKDLMKESIRLEVLMGPFVMLSVTFIRAGLTIMILTGVHLLTGGKLDVLTFVSFLIIGSRIFDPLCTALYNFSELRYDERAGERILGLMKEPIMTGNKKAPTKHGIEFKNVSFGYGEKEVLHNVSIFMPEGTLTALVGPSGSGKSTVMKLVARFYDPTKGKVLFGGVDERTIDPENLMKQISMVFQDVYLFQDTIGNNIRFGRQNATQKDVEEAAKKACCHDFIMKLPKKYDTIVGEGGCTLSGGEKQRISIARAMLKNAPVVLLDEATASLDPENEVEVQKAINKLIQDRTVIVIAHRLKTIKSADNIIVLQEGEIVEQGTHNDLINKDGLYRKLWNIQRESSGWKI